MPLDTRSPYAGNVNIDTEVFARPSSYANAFLGALQNSLPPPQHWTAFREALHSVPTDDGNFGLCTVDWSLARHAWLRKLPSTAAVAGRGIIFEILPQFAEARTRDAGPVAASLFETQASRAAKGVANPHLNCWEYFLRWRVSECVRLAKLFDAEGMPVIGWMITNETDGDAPQNAFLSRGPGDNRLRAVVHDLRIARTSRIFFSHHRRLRHRALLQPNPAIAGHLHRGRGGGRFQHRR